MAMKNNQRNGEKHGVAKSEESVSVIIVSETKAAASKQYQYREISNNGYRA